MTHKLLPFAIAIGIGMILGIAYLEWLG